MKKNRFSKVVVRSTYGLGLTLLGTVAALASSGGPFGTIQTFLNNDLLPGVAGVGVLGGLGYASIHAFKHDYGKAVVGMGVAAGGGIIVKNSSWLETKAQVSAATIGHHLPLAITALHATLHAIGL